MGQSQGTTGIELFIVFLREHVNTICHVVVIQKEPGSWPPECLSVGVQGCFSPFGYDPPALTTKVGFA